MGCEEHGDQQALAVHERIRNDGTTEKRRGPRRCQPTRLLKAHVAADAAVFLCCSTRDVLLAAFIFQTEA